MRHVLIAFAILSNAAYAQDLTASAPDSIVAQFQDAGLKAKLEKDELGDPMISSSAAGANFNLLFYDCIANKDCRSVQFNSCFDMPGDGASFRLINDWNVNMRYGRASLDEEMDPCLKMDIDMAAGMSVDAFQLNMSNWQGILGSFVTHLRK